MCGLMYGSDQASAPYAVAEWTFHKSGACVTLRLNVAGNDRTTSAQLVPVQPGPCGRDVDDLDNYGWAEIGDTLEWIRSCYSRLTEQSWILVSTKGVADQHAVAPTAPTATVLMPWADINSEIDPAVL